MKVYLIRHGSTQGNLSGRYIGKTDECLCGEGAEMLIKRQEKGAYPEADAVFASPLKRCMQTAGIIFPGKEVTAIPELSECDFGIFENKNYEDLKDVPQYQLWMESGGRNGFPGGESREKFARRILEGFEKALRMCGGSAAAFVVHGGTIMSIMEKYAYPKKGFYDFQVGNGEGYELTLADSLAGGDSGDSRVCAGSGFGRPELAVSSGSSDRSSDRADGKNYKKLFP